VIRNIDEYSPTAVTYFHQRDTGWNETNKEYLKALTKFKAHPKIKKYDIERKLNPVEVSSITQYREFFDTLSGVIEENRDNFDIIYVDCTGLPKLATVVALHLAGMHDNVYPIYNQNAVTARFDEQRDSQYASDEGKGPEPLPFTRIDISWANDKESAERKLLEASCFLVERSHEKTNFKFNRKDIMNELAKLGTSLSNIALGLALKKMLELGLFVKDPMSPRRYRLAMPGYALACRIFKTQLPRGAPVASKHPDEVGRKKRH